MSLDERRKALEDEFFRTKDNENIEKLRAEASAREKLGSLRKVSGISDEKLLGKMIDLGISEETLCAIRLVPMVAVAWARSEEHTSELQSRTNLVCRLLLEKKKNYINLHFRFIQFSFYCSSVP